MIIYYYKDKPYSIVAKSKIKASGVTDLLFSLGVIAFHREEFIQGKNDWLDVIIYQCEYDNPDGKIWVRTEKQFFELFKAEEKI
jgi:hypothetical protein